MHNSAVKPEISYMLSSNEINVVVGGTPRAIGSGNLIYQRLLGLLLGGTEKNAEEIDRLLNENEIVIQNEDHGDIIVKDTGVYFEGEKVHNRAAKKLMELLKSGMKESTPFINWIRRIFNNPSFKSSEELYDFMEHKGMAITREGRVLGYKGVKNDYYDQYSGTVLNMPGMVIEMDRRKVDDDRENGCSYGFHIGSFDYADSWAGSGGKLMLVEFDPADAVSVPHCADYQKLRVCKYTVVKEITENRKRLDHLAYSCDESGDYHPCFESDTECDYDTDYQNAKNWVRNRLFKKNKNVSKDKFLEKFPSFTDSLTLEKIYGELIDECDGGPIELQADCNDNAEITKIKSSYHG